MDLLKFIFYHVFLERFRGIFQLTSDFQDKENFQILARYGQCQCKALRLCLFSVSVPSTASEFLFLALGFHMSHFLCLGYIGRNVAI